MGGVVFDVNETLLDMSALDSLFEQAFGAGSMRQKWFALVKEILLVGLVTDRRQDFSAVARAALQMLQEQEERKVARSEEDAVIEKMKRLPPHPDVRPALRRLKDSGVTVAALTNGTSEALETQLEYAGLTSLFDQAMSAGEAGRLKPAAVAYRTAADRLGVSLSDLWVVAAHGWDISGAAAAGCRTAFVQRPGQALIPLDPPAEIRGAGLIEVVEAILRAGR